MGVERELVRHLVHRRIEDIPPETIRRQKLFFADTIGVAAGGVGAPGVQPVIDMIVETGGRPESSLLRRKQKVPSLLATLGNTFMAHALDFDDMHEEAGIHANVCVIPAALAVAEKIGGVDGKAILTAVVCGVDLACRLGVSIPLLRGWHATTTFGIFGAATAACKILGLDEEATANAFGIAYSQAAGNRQGRLEGTLTKRLQVALAAQSGVLAALLASRGLTGPKNFLEGDWGMLNLYTDREQKERRLAASDSLLKDLGKRFLGDELSMKPYPTCKATHTPIQNTIELMRQHSLIPEDVEEVSVLISNGAYQTAGRPFVIRTDPQVDAQFSIPYTVATAVLTGNIGLEDLKEETVRDNRRMEMTKRIKVAVDPELAEPSTNVVNLSSTVRIKARGRDYVMASRISKGHPESPMTVEEIFSKFLYCYRYGLARMPADKVRTFFNTIMSMEEVEDGSVFIRMLNEGG